jgi:lysozyme
MLDEDITICIAELQANIPHFNDHPDAVQETLVDLCFNLGISRLKNFKKTLGHIEEGLETGNYTKAAVELLESNYAKQLPARSKRNHDRLFNA